MEHFIGENKDTTGIESFRKEATNH